VGSEVKLPASSAADPDTMPDPIRLLVVDDAIEHARMVVEFLRSGDGWPDGMVTDVVMPHMNGREAAERLTTGRPKMKVLFMSGYTDHALMHREPPQGEAFIHKPFTPEVPARKVRQVLDSSTVRG
jgi:DNA-binding LytR/AlgR family response regulator